MDLSFEPACARIRESAGNFDSPRNRRDAYLSRKLYVQRHFDAVCLLPLVSFGILRRVRQLPPGRHADPTSDRATVETRRPNPEADFARLQSFRSLA
jgi:hypothetical protein